MSDELALQAAEELRAFQAAEAIRGFLPAKKVWMRYGVTSMTLHRWLRDDRLDFPKPMLIGRMRFWRIADLELWEAERSARSAA